MYAIRSKNKRGFVNNPNHGFGPRVFRRKTGALNCIRRLGLSEDKWEAVRVHLFVIDENDKPIDEFVTNHKLLDKHDKT